MRFTLSGQVIPVIGYTSIGIVHTEERDDTLVVQGVLMISGAKTGDLQLTTDILSSMFVDVMSYEGA